MLKFKKHLITGLAAAGIAITALSAYAEMPAGPRAAPTPEQQAKYEQHRAKREAEFHTKLGITASQEAAWQTFLGKIRPVRPATPPTRLSREDWKKMSTPDRLDHEMAFMKKAEARMSDRIAATKEFYAVLSPTQQKTFDEVFRHMQERRFKHGRFGHGRGHGPEHGPGPAQGPAAAK